MLSTALLLLLAMLLVLANAFFVASEFAIVKIRPSRLEELTAQGHRRAKRALAISQRLDAYLSANQLGITLASLALGWIGEPAFAALLAPLIGSAASHGLSVAASFAVITFLHTVVGELAPKSLALQHTEPVALWTAFPLHVFYLIAYPFITTLNAASSLVLRLVGLGRVSEAERVHSAHELRLVLQHVALDPSARSLIDRVFDYTRHVARHVMVMPNDVVVLRAERSFDENVKIAVANQYTRYPLVEGLPPRVLGYIHLKDLVSALAAQERPDLRRLVREPIYCAEDAPLELLRREIQRRGVHLVVVRERDGGFAGILTLEDLMEEFLGEIRDEQDTGEVAPIVRAADGSFEADGRLTLDVVWRELGLRLGPFPASVETLAGFLVSRLGRVPRVGDVVAEGGFRLIVLHLRDKRVARVRGEPVPDAGENDPISA